MSDNEKKYSYSHIIGYSVGGVNQALSILLPAQFLMIFFTNTALLDIAAISAIIGVSRIFDGISDVIIGNIIDTTRSKYGKARIWIRRMAIPFAVSMVLLFTVPAGLPEFAKYIYVFLTYNLFLTFCATFMVVSQTSLISLAADNMAERGKMSGALNFFFQLCKTLVGTFFVKILLIFSDDAANPHTRRGYFFTVLIFAIISVIASFTVFASTREKNLESAEKDRPKEKNVFLTDIKILLKNKYWLLVLISTVFTCIGNSFYSSATSYYTIYILHDFEAMSLFGLFPGIGGIITALLLTVLKTPPEKSRIYAVAHFVLAAATFTVYLAADNKSFLVAALLLTGIGMGCAGAVKGAIMAEAIEVSARKTGKTIAGVGFAGENAAQKFSMRLSTAVFGAIMASAGFDAALDSQGIAQPESVISAIRFCFCGVPVVAYLIIGFIFVFLFDIRKHLQD